MAFKDIITRLRRAVLCCSKRKRKLSLDIGHPTDVRRVDISDALPGLTDAERKYIREKASSDAIHLLGLQSHPPSHPPTSPPSPTESHSPSIATTSMLSSREPSVALLNAASKDLPSTLPTPPRRQHNENSPPSARMKSMWESTRRLSNSSSCHDGLYEKLEQIKDSNEKDRNESFTTLNLDFTFEDKKDHSESPKTLSLREGFEMQDTMGGHSQGTTPTKKDKIIERAIKATELSDSSDSDEDIFVSRESKPLVGV
ncbi:Nn.00g115250.m01.CDS01 [Neocucurbitaria sp. VM-36]